jgi:hypothetical protein
MTAAAHIKSKTTQLERSEWIGDLENSSMKNFSSIIMKS